jgi:FtsH-binding integral membrane protein
MQSSLIHNSHKFIKIAIGTAGVGATGGIGYLAYIANRNKYSDISPAVFSDRTKQRLQTTFGYIGEGIGVTAIAATAAFRSRRFQNNLLPMIGRHPIAAFCGCLGLTFTTLIGTMTTNKDNIIQKQALYIAFCSSIGLTLASAGIIGGPLVLRAVTYTGALTGGLALISANSPSKQFLTWAAPLSAGLSVIVAASFGSLFFPVTGAAFSALHSVSLYGGLVVFTGLVIVDTQKIIQDAEVMDDKYFDPINTGLQIYPDTIYIFIKIVEVLAKK